MITDGLFSEALFPVVCWSLFCWTLGVGYAAYRAIGWADRIRAWAGVSHKEPCSTCFPSHEDESAGGFRSFSGAPLVGAAGSAVRGDLEADES